MVSSVPVSLKRWAMAETRLSGAFIDGLPRSASGKVLKRILREPFWEGHRRGVS
jgi:acyl-CoA synthetase (AMP-forming)/AMP-acid ligase II